MYAAFGDFCANCDEILKGTGCREALRAIFVGEIGGRNVEGDKVSGGEGVKKSRVATDEVKDSNARM